MPSPLATSGPADPTVLAALRSPRLLRTEVLAGLVVALALIPEAISFSIIAGVDPRVGLFASFTMAVAISFLGGRPAMISAATGAVALVIAPVMRDHGYDYLIATVLLGGLIQIGLALAGVARLTRFLPRSVMVGFVNALAILVLQAQIVHMVDVPWAVYPMIAVGIAVIVGFPRINKVIPARWSRSSRSPPSPSSPRSTCRTSATRAICPTACRPGSSLTYLSASTRCRSSPPTPWAWLWSACSSR